MLAWSHLVGQPSNIEADDIKLLIFSRPPFVLGLGHKATYRMDVETRVLFLSLVVLEAIPRRCDQKILCPCTIASHKEV